MIKISIFVLENNVLSNKYRRLSFHKKRWILPPKDQMDSLGISSIPKEIVEQISPVGYKNGQESKYRVVLCRFLDFLENFTDFKIFPFVFFIHLFVFTPNYFLLIASFIPF